MKEWKWFILYKKINQRENKNAHKNKKQAKLIERTQKWKEVTRMEMVDTLKKTKKESRENKIHTKIQTSKTNRTNTEVKRSDKNGNGWS